MASRNNNRSKFVSYMSLPSLEEIALTSLAGTAWKIPEVQRRIRDHEHDSYMRRSYYESYEKSPCRIEGPIMDTLKELLAQRFREKAATIVRALGFQVFEWIHGISEDYSDLYDSASVANAICWTTMGTIDRRRTFEALLRQKNVDNVRDLYNLACSYCLEDYVLELWPSIPEEDTFYAEEVYGQEEYFLIAYWTRFAKKTSLSSQLTNEGYTKALKISVEQNNCAATKYFWNKLTDERKTKKLAKLTELAIDSRNNNQRHYDYHKSNEFTELLCFLLSETKTESRQRKAFEGGIDDILETLLYNGPWQQYLLPTMRATWDHYNEGIYGDFLPNVTREIKNGGASVHLLLCMWPELAAHIKKCILGYTKGIVDMLCDLFTVDDTETVRLILRDATEDRRKKIATVTIKSHRLVDLLYTNKVAFFEVLCSAAMLSEREVRSLKNRLVKEHCETICWEFIMEERWQDLDAFLNWCFRSEEEIANFKRDNIDKANIVFSFIEKGNYQLIDNFLKWCCLSEEEIHQLKRQVANHRRAISSFSYGKWSKFEKFLGWCFDTDEEIVQYKEAEFPREKMGSILKDITRFGHHFEFARNLLKWLLDSDEEVLRFKRQLMLSKIGVEMFESHTLSSISFHPEMPKKVKMWYGPLDEPTILKFKKMLKASGKFNSEGRLEKAFKFVDLLNQCNFADCETDFDESADDSGENADNVMDCDSSSDSSD